MNAHTDATFEAMQADAKKVNAAVRAKGWLSSTWAKPRPGIKVSTPRRIAVYGAVAAGPSTSRKIAQSTGDTRAYAAQVCSEAHTLGHMTRNINQGPAGYEYKMTRSGRAALAKWRAGE